MTIAYYNEIDPFAAQWLRNLIAAGHIAPGEVDERSIRDVHPADLLGYDQCHFFAGIGVWSHALRLAGWDDARPVWTGSCPCQPFSAAGQRGGFADDRHLWPEFYRLIGAHRPHVVFGEQVASKDGLAWLDTVQTDLEGADYAFGALDLCAAGFGAPHIRQRLYFVADNDKAGRGIERRQELLDRERPAQRNDADGRSEDGELAYADGGNACAEGLQRGRQHGQQPQDCGAGSRLADTAIGTGQPGEPQPSKRAVARCDGEVLACDVGNADDAGPQGRGLLGTDTGRHRGSERTARPADLAGERAVEHAAGEQVGLSGRARQPGGSHWAACDWLPCIDGKARPVEPGTFPLAHGIAGRVGRLRAYGNAIVAPVAAEFIRAYRECRP